MPEMRDVYYSYESLPLGSIRLLHVEAEDESSPFLLGSYSKVLIPR